MGPEAKLYKNLKENLGGFIWNRIENISIVGMPDVLGYNRFKRFFTLELKVTKSNTIKFSPHQIAFHLTHSNGTFILIKHLGQRGLKLFPGSVIQELKDKGFKTKEIADSWTTIQVALDAWRL
jgi:Holliday junction resolvase